MISLFLKAHPQRFDGGMIAGIVASQLDGDKNAGYNKLGFSIGGFVDTKLKNNFGMMMEIRYIQKGSNGYDSLKILVYRSRLHYIEVPVYLNYTYKKKYFAEAGLSAGYLINAKEAIEDFDLAAAKPEFNKFELAAHAGIGYHLSEKFTALARFSYSALEVRKYYPEYYLYFDRGQYNHLIQLCLLYKFK